MPASEGVSLRRLDAVITALVVASASTAVATLVDGGAGFAVLQALAPSLGVIVFVVAIAAVARRRLVTAAVAVVAALVMLVPVLTAPIGDVPRSSRTLSVLSASTYVGRIDADALMREVDARSVDVLVLPEMTEEFWSELRRRGLTSRLPHVTGRTGGGRGMVVATRTPVTCLELMPGVTCGEVTADDGSEYAYDAQGRPAFDQIVVRLPDGTHLRAVHAWSPRMPPMSRWQEDQRDTAQWIAAQPTDLPLVLAGDFNAGRSHPVFRRYSAGLDESPRGGFPWTRTWPRWDPIPPFTQIDHVLARGWRATESEPVSIPGSDHRAIWTLLTR
ncbi:endonuclease/exonuclease/phosphatase family protein [Mobilicoccus massiliensis]|uniref:endonuclease/exonuclease/phosphatase family protein n=1 Tax=Mobilicoccus massiliensis TaxID=1522310 RepID=UPI000590D2BE|nr:endonuclease/exonuclease/phosphatase family protein [Mobilicoccus massiliensis]